MLSLGEVYPRVARGAFRLVENVEMKAQGKTEKKTSQRTAARRAGASPACALCTKLTCLSFADFRKAIRAGAIDALTAKRIFRHHFTRLRDICKRENCSLNRARTINAALECDVNAALLCAGKPGILKAYASVEDLIKELES